MARCPCVVTVLSPPLRCHPHCTRLCDSSALTSSALCLPLLLRLVNRAIDPYTNSFCDVAPPSVPESADAGLLQKLTSGVQPMVHQPPSTASPANSQHSSTRGYYTPSHPTTSCHSQLFEKVYTICKAPLKEAKRLRYGPSSQVSDSHVMFTPSISVERWHTTADGKVLQCIQSISQPPTVFMGGAGGCSCSARFRSKAFGIPIRVKSPCRSSLLSIFEAIRNKASKIQHCVPRTAVGLVHEWNAERAIVCLSELRTSAATLRPGYPIRRIPGHLPAPHRWYDRSKRRVGFLEPLGKYSNLLYIIEHL